MLFRLQGHNWCRKEESNLRPSHYECAALPTELFRRGRASIFGTQAECNTPAFASTEMRHELVQSKYRRCANSAVTCFGISESEMKILHIATTVPPESVEYRTRIYTRFVSAPQRTCRNPCPGPSLPGLANLRIRQRHSCPQIQIRARIT